MEVKLPQQLLMGGRRPGPDRTTCLLSLHRAEAWRAWVSGREQSEVTLGSRACLPWKSGRLLMEPEKSEQTAGRMRRWVWNTLSLTQWDKQKQPQLWKPRL